MADKGTGTKCIIVKSLKKHYGKDSLAVNNVSFSVQCGTVFGLLGPNGAGKTTTIKMLTGLIKPSSGTVEIFGLNLIKNPMEIKRKMGIVLQKPSFESHLSIERSIDVFGMLWGVTKNERKKRVKTLLEIFDLEEIKDKRYEELSVGYRRRVQVAREFIHDMDLLFLDEPTVGLDPNSRRIVLDFVKAEVKKGLTVFFTTHIMEEAEYLCDEIAIINNGKIVAHDTPLGLKQKYGGMKTIDIELGNETASLALPLIVNNIQNYSNLESYSRNGLRFNSLNTDGIIKKIIEVFSDNGIQINNISIREPSLEDVFLTITENRNSIGR